MKKAYAVSLRPGTEGPRPCESLWDVLMLMPEYHVCEDGSQACLAMAHKVARA